MVRSVLIFIYIALVLLVSGLARAGEFAQVDGVHFDQKTSMLHVTGEFSNTCQSAPKPVVIRSEKVDAVTDVVLGVEVEVAAGQMCAEVLGGRYDLIVDIRSLNLPVKEDLIIKFKNVAEGVSLDPLTTRIDRPAHGLEFSSKAVTGQLVELPIVGSENEPVYVVIGDNGTFTQVKTLIDLSYYLNNKVRVSGIELGTEIGPELGNSDVGFEDFSSKTLEKVFAMGVSLTPLQ